MVHPLVQKIIDYPNKRVIEHAKEVYCWDRLTKEEEAHHALEILKYANDVQTIMRGQF